MRRKKKKKLDQRVFKRLTMIQNGISILKRQPKGDTKKKLQIDLSWIDYEEEYAELEDLVFEL